MSATWTCCGSASTAARASSRPRASSRGVRSGAVIAADGEEEPFDVVDADRLGRDAGLLVSEVVPGSPAAAAGAVGGTRGHKYCLPFTISPLGNNRV